MLHLIKVKDFESLRESGEVRQKFEKFSNQRTVKSIEERLFCLLAKNGRKRVALHI